MTASTRHHGSLFIILFTAVLLAGVLIHLATGTDFGDDPASPVPTYVPGTLATVTCADSAGPDAHTYVTDDESLGRAGCPFVP